MNFAPLRRLGTAWGGVLPGCRAAVVFACAAGGLCTLGVPEALLGGLHQALAELPASVALERLGWADPLQRLPTWRAFRPRRIDSVGWGHGPAGLGARALLVRLGAVALRAGLARRVSGTRLGSARGLPPWRCRRGGGGPCSPPWAWHGGGERVLPSAGVGSERRNTVSPMGPCPCTTPRRSHRDGLMLAHEVAVMPCIGLVGGLGCWQWNPFTCRGAAHGRTCSVAHYGLAAPPSDEWCDLCSGTPTCLWCWQMCAVVMRHVSGYRSAKDFGFDRLLRAV